MAVELSWRSRASRRRRSAGTAAANRSPVPAEDALSGATVYREPRRRGVVPPDEHGNHAVHAPTALKDGSREFVPVVVLLDPPELAFASKVRAWQPPSLRHTGRRVPKQGP